MTARKDKEEGQREAFRFIAYLIQQAGGTIRVPIRDLYAMNDQPIPLIEVYDDPDTYQRVYTVRGNMP